MKHIDNADEIINDAYGLSFYSFFSTVDGWNPDLELNDLKENFLIIIDRLLKERRVVFVCPCELRSDPEKAEIWNANPEEIVGYLRTHWPTNAKYWDDEIMLEFLYDRTFMYWLDENGQFIGG